MRFRPWMGVNYHNPRGILRSTNDRMEGNLFNAFDNERAAMEIAVISGLGPR
jgi:hypothetical protein